MKRDSTVLTIGKVRYNELQLPCVEIVHQQWWTGMTYPEQYAATLALCETWDIRRLVIDNTGQGAGLASLLIEKLGDQRQECWQQIKAARYSLPAPETINFYVDQAEGHDDFLTSLALCAQAMEAIIHPSSRRRESTGPTDVSRGKQIVALNEQPCRITSNPLDNLYFPDYNITS